MKKSIFKPWVQQLNIGDRVMITDPVYRGYFSHTKKENGSKFYQLLKGYTNQTDEGKYMRTTGDDVNEHSRQIECVVVGIDDSNRPMNSRLYTNIYAIVPVDKFPSKDVVYVFGDTSLTLVGNIPSGKTITKQDIINLMVKMAEVARDPNISQYRNIAEVMFDIYINEKNK